MDTKTNTKTQTKTNTKCFKDPMYAIFLKISGCKDFKHDMDNGHGHVERGRDGHGRGGHKDKYKDKGKDKYKAHTMYSHLIWQLDAI